MTLRDNLAYLPTRPITAYFVEEPIVPSSDEVGQPVEPQAPTDGGFQVPDKFQGKTQEEIIKAYSELEKKLGERTNSPDLSKLEKLIETKFNDLRQTKETPISPEDDEINTRNKEYAKSIGLATIDDVNSAREEGYRKAMLSLTANQLESKYDGKDGRPAFKTQEIANWVTSQAPEYLKGAPLEAVYEAMYSKEITDWKIKQALTGNRAPAVPKGGPKPAPGTPDVSKMTPEQRRVVLIERLNAEA